MGVQTFEFLSFTSSTKSTTPLKQPPLRSTEFYIVSEKNGKVLDIADVPQKNKKSVICMPVTHTKLYPPPKSQLWYTDELTGFVHSALNDAVFTEGSLWWWIWM